MDVVSGALLGRMRRLQKTPFILGQSSGFQTPAGHLNVRTPHRIVLHYKDQILEYPDPIRAAAPPCSTAGVEPFTTARPYADLSSALLSARELPHRSGTAQRQR